MTRTSGSRIAARRVAAVVVVAVGVVVAPSVAAQGADPPPPPGPPVPLAEGLTSVGNVTFAEDAVFFADHPNQVSAIYRRPMTTGPDGTTFGDAEVVGIAQGLFAQDDGTLAYLRAGDRHLVFRSPDGTVTAPTWWETYDTAWVMSVLALTDDVVVLQHGGEVHQVRIVDRDDGKTYVPEGLVDLPEGFSSPQTTDVQVTDGRVLWTMVGSDDDANLGWKAVYTVAFGPDGPQGDVVELASAVIEYVPGAWITPDFFSVDVTGDRVVWQRYDVSPDGAREVTLQWYPAAPYAGEPLSAAIPADAGWFDGEIVTLVHDIAMYGDLEWVDVADPATPIHAMPDVGFAFDVAGTLVAYAQSGIGIAYVADAAGGAVTVSAAPVPRLELSDLDWSDPFILEVLWMVDEGIATGYADGTFRSSASVNRDSMAAFLHRMVTGEGDPPTCTSAAFTDVPADHPFCPAITWLAATGITTGWPDGTYRPAEPVTREAMAAFLYRVANDGADAPACTTPPFRDVRADNPFCGEIAWLAGTGVARGWPDGTFRPASWIERQAMAAFLFRFVNAGLVPAPL